MYQDAKLIEVTEGSYLIRNRINLPIFGKQMNLIMKTKNNFLKGSYLR